MSGAEQSGQPLPRLCIPTNMQEDLIDRLDFSRVKEVYGKLREDFVGGGRSSLILPKVVPTAAKRHVREIKARGASFNYLLNATCLNNIEFTRSGRRLIEKAVKAVVDLGADSVTVSIPHVMEIVRKVAPHLRIGISTMAGVDSPEMAGYFQTLGADKITLSVTDVNRDFRRLAAIRSRFSGELQVIANLDCLRGCPFTRYHGNLNSHSSQSWHESGGFVIDYCFLSCSILRLKEPANFLAAGWIRPEDQHHYSNVGIDTIKLVSRAMTSQQIALVVDAYTRARYDGNLLDLFSHPTTNVVYSRKDPLAAMKYLFRPGKVNLFKLAKYWDMFHWPRPVIDNRSLDGFIDWFVDGKCQAEQCGVKCRYCFDTAARVFKMDQEERDKALARLEEFKELLIGGGLFRWRG